MTEKAACSFINHQQVSSEHATVAVSFFISELQPASFPNIIRFILHLNVVKPLKLFQPLIFDPDLVSELQTLFSLVDYSCLESSQTIIVLSAAITMQAIFGNLLSVHVFRQKFVYNSEYWHFQQSDIYNIFTDILWKAEQQLFKSFLMLCFLIIFAFVLLLAAQCWRLQRGPVIRAECLVACGLYILTYKLWAAMHIHVYYCVYSWDFKWG